jgi:hypothetical protein
MIYRKSISVKILWWVAGDSANPAAPDTLDQADRAFIALHWSLSPRVNEIPESPRNAPQAASSRFPRAARAAKWQARAC